MSRVLVTGGSGYVGRQTVKALSHAGYEVTVFDIKPDDGRLSKYADYIQGDVTNIVSIKDAMSSYPDAVVHLAGLARADQSMRTPIEYWIQNVNGTVNLLEAMLLFGVDKLVFSSSCAVYGDALKQPIIEGAKIRPVSVYGETKMAAELAIQAASLINQIRSIRLRYFNVAGADSELEFGEDDDNGRAIPTAIRCALDQTPFYVYGDQYKTKDGSAIRDYLSVEDIADAHVKAIERVGSTKGYIFMNLGSGSFSSVFDVVKAVNSVVGKDVPVEVKPPRGGDPAIAWTRAIKAKELLDWIPKRSALKDIVKSAYDYELKRRANAA